MNAVQVCSPDIPEEALYNGNISDLWGYLHDQIYLLKGDLSKDFSMVKDSVLIAQVFFR